MPTLIANPFNSPWFEPAAYRISSLLALGLLLILYVLWRKKQEVFQAPLFVKWRTWAIISVLFVFAALSGPLGIALLVAGLIWQGLREYAELVGLAPHYRGVLLAMGLTATPVGLISLDGFYLLAPLLLLIAVAQPLAFQAVQGGIRQLALSSLGWAYIAWLLAHLVLISRHIPDGAGIILLLGVSVALSDNAAFAIGSLFGKHKLTALSPNKTWEGLIGNLIGAYLGTALMSFVLPEKGYWIMVVFLPPLIAAGSVWGDLFESAIKREAGVKDAGSWLPGFGGILDRIDSLILVAPLSYYFLRFVL